MNKKEMEAIIPHRGNMLLLDAAHVTQEGLAEGFATIRGDEYFLDGHFPGNPTVPGVILCEMMAQTCAVLLGKEAEGATPYFSKIKDMIFKHKVIPGETVRFLCKIKRKMSNFFFATGEGYVEDTLCVKGEIVIALVQNG